MGSSEGDSIVRSFEELHTRYKIKHSVTRAIAPITLPTMAPKGTLCVPFVPFVPFGLLVLFVGGWINMMFPRPGSSHPFKGVILSAPPVALIGD